MPEAEQMKVKEQLCQQAVATSIKEQSLSVVS